MFVLVGWLVVDGKKGLVHTTAGYLSYAALTHQKLFDFRAGSRDVHACVADIGWITGHTYIVYGPLLNGATSLMFEGVSKEKKQGNKAFQKKKKKIGSDTSWS
jgi:acyl-coenzyme A synthetase/AMP-(fatty) acid ligase